MEIKNKTDYCYYKDHSLNFGIEDGLFIYVAHNFPLKIVEIKFYYGDDISFIDRTYFNV